MVSPEATEMFLLPCVQDIVYFLTRQLELKDTQILVQRRLLQTNRHSHNTLLKDPF